MSYSEDYNKFVIAQQLFFCLFFFTAASRETAYVFALSSGAVSHAIARACAKGAVPDCGCGQKPVQSQPTKDFVWAGCSDNVRYANTFGRRFMDAVDQPHSHDAR